MKSSGVSLSSLQDLHPTHIWSPCFSAKSSLLDLSCLFSLSTTPLTLDFHCNSLLSFLFWIFYIFLRSSSSPVLLSFLPKLPILFFLWFLSMSFLLFLVLLFVPNSYIFWSFPTIYFSYFSYCLPVFFLSPHYFLFLSFLGIEACSLLYSRLHDDVAYSYLSSYCCLCSPNLVRFYWIPKTTENYRNQPKTTEN